MIVGADPATELGDVGQLAALDILDRDRIERGGGGGLESFLLRIEDGGILPQLEQLGLVGTGEAAVVDDHRSLETQRGDRAPGGARVERPDPAVADIGGDGQPLRVEEVGLDVAPVSIGHRRGEADRIVAGLVIAGAGFHRCHPVALEAADRRVADREPARPEALLVAHEQDHAMPRLGRCGDRGQELGLRSLAAVVVERGGEQPPRRIERAARQARMGEPPASGEREPVERRHREFAEQRRLVDPVEHAGGRRRLVQRTERTGEACAVVEKAGAHHPAETVAHRPRQPVLARHHRGVVVLVEQARERGRERRVEALVDLLAHDRARRGEAQIAPVLRDGQLAQPVIVLVWLGNRAAAGEWRRVAIGVLAVVAVDVLHGHAGVDRPAVARRDPEHRAAALGVDAVDVALLGGGVVDIAAVAASIADHAQRRPVAERHIEHRRSVPAGRAVRDGGGAGAGAALEPAEHGVLADDTDDPAGRSGAVERALRPFEHLDRGDVVELQVGIGGVVVEAQVAPIFAHRRLRLADQPRIGDPPDEQLVAPRAEMGGGDAGRAADDAVAVGGPAARHVRTRQDRHGAGEVSEPGATLARADHDGVGGDGGRRVAGMDGRAGARRDLPALRAEWDGVRVGRRGHAPQRLAHRQRAADRGRGALPQPGVGEPDARAGEAAQGDDRIAERAGGQVDRMARVGMGESRRQQRRGNGDQGKAELHCWGRWG